MSNQEIVALKPLILVLIILFVYLADTKYATMQELQTAIEALTFPKR